MIDMKDVKISLKDIIVIILIITIKKLKDLLRQRIYITFFIRPVRLSVSCLRLTHEQKAADQFGLVHNKCNLLYHNKAKKSSSRLTGFTKFRQKYAP